MGHLNGRRLGDLFFRALFEKSFHSDARTTGKVLDLMVKQGVLDATMPAPAFDLEGAKAQLARKLEMARRSSEASADADHARNETAPEAGRAANASPDGL